MKLLLVAATEGEISPLLQHMQPYKDANDPLCYIINGNTIRICLTGVGMMATAYAVTKALLQGQYDFALQAGVAGSFDRDIQLGQLVLVSSEQYGDLGAEDHYNFLDVFELGLANEDFQPFSKQQLITPPSPLFDTIQLPKVSGLTVNTVSGNEFTVKRRSEKYHCQLESMEGAAFHYACLNEGIPFAQVRSISNYVAPRDKSKWQMKDAIIGLNKWLIDFLEGL